MAQDATMTMTPCGTATGVEYWDPLAGAFTPRREDLELASATVQQLLAAGGLDPADVPSVGTPGVSPGQVVVRRRTGGNGSGAVTLPARGAHIEADGDGALRATRYGFLSLEDETLSVRSPLQVSPDGMVAVWVDGGAGSGALTRAMVETWLDDLEVICGLDTDAIEALVEGRLAPGRAHVLARGVPPETGGIAFEVDPQPRPPALDVEGAMVRDNGPLAPRVHAGQLLARWREGHAGQDVYGREVAAGPPVTVGPNILVEVEGEERLLRAAVDGALRLDGERLEVVELLTLKGDFAATPGHIKFPGEVFVDDAVRTSITIEAGGSVTIAGDLPAGSEITSARDVTVAGGLVGQRTRVRAVGSVSARCAEGGRVEAGADIVLRSHARGADLRAGGRIVIGDVTGGRRGVVDGGRLWGQEGVQAGSIGNPNGGVTTVAAGVGPEAARDLERLDHSLTTCYEHILRLLRRFQLASIDVPKIQQLIRACRGPQRRALAHSARQLARLAELYRDFQRRHRDLEEGLGTVTAEVKANIVYPGVRVRVGARHQDIQETLHDVRFHLDDHGLETR